MHFSYMCIAFPIAKGVYRHASTMAVKQFVHMLQYQFTVVGVVILAPMACDVVCSIIYLHIVVITTNEEMRGQKTLMNLI